HLDADGHWRTFSTGHGLSYHAARFVFEDREGSWWIGTSGGGLHRFKRRQVVNWGPAQGLPERVVVSLTLDPQGRMLLGTFGKGVVRLEGGQVSPVAATLRDSPLVQSLLVDRRGRPWMGSVGA